jgi:ribosomal protein L17
VSGPAKGKWTAPAPIDALTPAPLKESLTAAEQNELTRLETVIQKGWTTFLDVGRALMTIKNDELYSDKYETFDEYLRVRWEMSRSHAYNLIGSTEVYDELSAMADITIKPTNERQIRSLISVPKNKLAVTWKKVVKEADGKPVTAKLVNQVAAEFKPRKTGKPTKAAKKPASAPRPNLKPAFKLIDVIEELAGNDKNLLSNIRSLRECLKKIGREK